MALEPSPWSCR